jgi:hypothetical protein
MVVLVVVSRAPAALAAIMRLNLPKPEVLNGRGKSSAVQRVEARSHSELRPA